MGVSSVACGRVALCERIFFLISRQKEKDKFISEILGIAANKEGRFAGIGDDISERASEMLDEYKENSDVLQGNFMGGDFKRELLRISPWNSGGSGD